MGRLSKIIEQEKELTTESPFPERFQGRRMWNRIFGDVSRDREEAYKQPPVRGGSYGRSSIAGSEATKRLLQALRSMAPGGWSDGRSDFSVVFSRGSSQSVFRRPTRVDSIVNESEVAKSQFLTPLDYRLSSSVDGSFFRAVHFPPHRDGQCIFYRPTPFDTSEYGGRGDPKFFGPLRNTQSLSSERKKFVMSGVSLLFLSCRPSTIFRTVPSAVVNPIERVTTTGLGSHVGQETPEAFEPLVADFDSSATVVGVSDASLVHAPLPHVYPGIPLGRIEFCNAPSRWSESTHRDHPIAVGVNSPLNILKGIPPSEIEGGCK